MSVCGVTVFIFFTFSIQCVYHMVSYRFQLHFAFNRAFLHSCVNVLARVRPYVCAACPLCVCVAALSPGQALDMLLAGDTVCGFSSRRARSGGRKRCVPPKPPPPPFYHQQNRPSPRSPCSPFPGPQSLGCGLWMSATSWLSAQGLAGDWPVVEVQYQALSVSSSFHFLPPLGAV